ncbi:MAG: hypothetical protein NTW54_08880 [Bacteroidetes bacterium]|nr:hypothetical protein [Bacteroidota bacterium]
MKKVFLTLVIAMFALTATYAQGKKDVAVTKKKVEATRGANTNIKVDVPSTDVEAPKPSKTRGTCTVAFTNNTGYYVKVYLDGTYKGTLSPYESGSVTVYSGYTTIYCITTGGTYDWSAAGNCEGTYTYALN